MSDVMEPEDQGRIPPQDLEAEQSVLGGLLLDGRAVLEVSHWLKPDDFYRTNHAAIYSACCRVAGRSEPVDSVTIGNQLDRDGLLNRVGGRSYLSILTGIVPTSLNTIHYARIVRQKAQLRAAIMVGQTIIDKGYNPASEASDVLAEAQREILNATQDRQLTVFRSSGQILNETTSHWDAMQAGKAVLGLPTGYSALDTITTGAMGGDLWTIAARPSIGKTALLLNIALKLATGRASKNKKPLGVGILSLEMTSQQLMERLVAMEARVEASKMRLGQMNDLEADRYGKALGPLGDMTLWIDDDPVLDETTLIAKAQRLCAQHQIDVLMVDYLQRMRGLPKYKGDKRLETAGQSAALKDVARQLNVPVFVASQLTREVDKRPDKKPMLSDLMETGAIEADSDVVLLIHRPAFYFKDKPEFKNKANIIVAKQRRGPTTDHIWLGFNETLTKFYEMKEDNPNG